jgi:hypothetical protein
MARKKEMTEVENAAAADIYLVESSPENRGPGGGDYWPLASVKGGVDRITVERRGNTTIIKIVSPGGGSYLDPDGWDRPKREWRSRSASQAKAKPS